MTHWRGKSWWRVDLGTEELISNIKITNFRENSHMFKNFEITIGNDDLPKYGGVKTFGCRREYTYTCYNYLNYYGAGRGLYGSATEQSIVDRNLGYWDYTKDPNWHNTNCRDSSKPMNSDKFYPSSGSFGSGATRDIKCDSPVMGRYVYIQLTESGPAHLYLTEVEVYAAQNEISDWGEVFISATLSSTINTAMVGKSLLANICTKDSSGIEKGCAKLGFNTVDNTVGGKYGPGNYALHGVAGGTVIWDSALTEVSDYQNIDITLQLSRDGNTKAWIGHSLETDGLPTGVPPTKSSKVDNDNMGSELDWVGFRKTSLLGESGATVNNIKIVITRFGVKSVIAEQPVLADGRRTMRITREDIGKSMLRTSAIFACTIKGCSSPTKGSTRLPSAPEIASIRVISKDQLIFDILAPRNDGGANVQKYTVTRDLEEDEDGNIPTETRDLAVNNGVVNGVFDQIDIGTGSKEFIIGACTLLGCSSETITTSTKLPQSPTSFSIRIVNRDQLIVQITAPTNSGSAVVTKYKVIVGSSTTNLMVSLATVGKLLGRVGVGSTPKVFTAYACSLVGCSAFPVDTNIVLPSKPSDLYIMNKKDSQDTIVVNVAPPENDGGANLNGFEFTTECYVSDTEIKTKTQKILLVDMDDTEEVGDEMKTAEIATPTDASTANTCRVTAKACTPVGCSELTVDNWNVGVDASTTATLVANSQVRTELLGSFSLAMISQPESGKANPVTTDLRWRHVINAVTYETLKESEFPVQKTDEDGSTKYLGDERLGIAFTSSMETHSFDNIARINDLEYTVARRHCIVQPVASCSEWESILTVIGSTTPGVPSTPTITQPLDGGILVASWDPPEYFGYQSILRGRSYIVHLYGTEQNGVPKTVPMQVWYTNQTSVSSNPDLFHFQKFSFTVTALNGDVPGTTSAHSISTSPLTNVPGVSAIAPLVSEIQNRDVQVTFTLPAQHGIKLTKCALYFATLDSCGIDAAKFQDRRLYHYGLIASTNRLGFNAQAPNSLEITPPTDYSSYTVFVDGLVDATEYAVKIACLNNCLNNICDDRLGEGLMSVPSLPFRTPAILTGRNISIVYGNDEACTTTLSLTCRSLTHAVSETIFARTSYYLDDGVYKQGSLPPPLRFDAPVEIEMDTGMDQITSNNSSNTSKLPAKFYGENFPISFKFKGSQIISMSDDPTKTTLDCGKRRCFDLSQGDPLLLLRGLSLINGESSDTLGGGAIYAPMSNSARFGIMNCIFFNHTSTVGNGGALLFVRAKLDITNTKFISNKAGNSGGAVAIDSSEVIFSQVHFQDNSAATNGGVLVASSDISGASVTMSQTTSDGNSASGSGGCLSVVGAVVQIDNSDFDGDKAEGFQGKKCFLFKRMTFFNQ